MVCMTKGFPWPSEGTEVRHTEVSSSLWASPADVENV